MNKKINEIKKNLTTSHIGKNIYYVKTTDSTNNLAKKHISYPCGTVFLSDIQTNGKGRNNRLWVSDDFLGLWFSILLKPQITVEKIAQITLLTGISVVETLNKDFFQDTKIKWPNDIVLSDKKLGGILCESIFYNNELSGVICGIGLNINQHQFPLELNNIATSLKEEYNKDFNKDLILSKILNRFEEYYDIFLKEGFSPLLDLYKSYCITLNKELLLDYNGEKINAKAIDISQDGNLIIKKDDELIEVSSGEVSVRGLFGYV